MRLSDVVLHFLKIVLDRGGLRTITVFLLSIEVFKTKLRKWIKENISIE